jgi:hypothetical protein
VRVARDVRERLLGDPVRGRLDRGRQRRQGVRLGDLAAELGATERGRVLAQRAGESELVERRRP